MQRFFILKLINSRDLIGSEKTGFYYLYEQSNNGYNVYKAYPEKPNAPIYLFSVNDVDRTKYINDDILFVDNNFVKIYSNKGIRTLIKYDELAFNKNIQIYGYYN